MPLGDGAFAGVSHLQSDRLKRRDFVTLLGAALAWSCRANAQERPVVGFLSFGSATAFKPFVDAFRQTLGERGFIEDQNLAIEYRWAEGEAARLQGMTADLIRRRVSLFATGGTLTARVAQGLTSTIPILFISGPDPEADGLVKSLNRPGGNLTGVALYTSQLVPKRLELLNELVPGVKTIALLVNPTDVANHVELKEFEAATQKTKQKMVILKAASEDDFESAFDTAIKQGANALLISANPFFTSRRGRLVALATRHAIPTAYPWHQYVEAGGLMSYGPSIVEAYRLIGRYAGRILKGESPSNLPVQIPNEFELTINVKAVKRLGLTVPNIMRVRAHQLID